MKKKVSIGLKLDRNLVRNLRAAAKGQYAPTMTAIVERGTAVELRRLKRQEKNETR